MWNVTIAQPTQIQSTAVGDELAADYGGGVFRFPLHGRRHWTGQPVILTYTKAQSAAGQSYPLASSWPISSILLIHPMHHPPGWPRLLLRLGRAWVGGNPTTCAP
jgi:hypothetical protein